MIDYIRDLKEGLLISFQAIAASPIRSVLTTLGIVIGVASVVLMSTAVKGIDQSFQKGVSSLGSDNLYIDKWEWFNQDKPWWELRNRKNLDIDDFKEFERLAKLPLAVAPSVWANLTIKFKDLTAEAITVTGTNHNYINTTNLDFLEGRFFTELESNSGRGVAILGSSIAETLFPDGGALGNFVTVKGRKLKIIGVLTEQGSYVMGSFNPDNQVYIPIEFMYKYFSNKTSSSLTINVRARNTSMVNATKEEAIDIMRRIRGLKYNEENDFSINQQEGLLGEINKTVGVIQIGGYLITALALVVGAIGIMNIMFVSVKERTREIGIRKAIGAKRRNILSQFLIEASVICLIGGAIGFLVAVIGVRIIETYDFPVSLQYDAVILAIIISLLTGLVSGYAPAHSASKLDPVDALRYE